MQIRQQVKDAMGEAVRVRRELHMHPEVSNKEYNTQNFIYDYMEELNPDRLERLAGTGVKAVFLTDGATRTTAFRTDTDALPLAEGTGLPFASQNPGVMHACGHDAHMSIALTTARLVAENRAALRDNVTFLFQPAEEGGYGAVNMIRDGALENPHVDRIFGQHVMPGLALGKIEIMAGVFTSRAVGFNIIVRGKKSHGASPHMGVDALVATAQLVLSMQTIVSRNVAPSESAVLTIGTIKGGEQRNILCSEVEIACTLRTLNDEVHDLVFRRVHELLSGLETAFGVTTEFHEIQDYPSVVNDAALAREYAALIEDSACEAKPLTIGEDFAEYQKLTPGLFVGLGIGDHTPLHSVTFDLDEDAMMYSVEANLRLLGI